MDDGGFLKFRGAKETAKVEDSERQDGEDSVSHDQVCLTYHAFTRAAGSRCHLTDTCDREARGA